MCSYSKGVWWGWCKVWPTAREDWGSRAMSQRSIGPSEYSELKEEPWTSQAACRRRPSHWGWSEGWGSYSEWYSKRSSLRSSFKQNPPLLKEVSLGIPSGKLFGQQPSLWIDWMYSWTNHTVLWSPGNWSDQVTHLYNMLFYHKDHRISALRVRQFR